MRRAVLFAKTCRRLWLFRPRDRRRAYARSAAVELRTSEPDQRTPEPPNLRTPELLLLCLLVVSCSEPPKTYEQELTAWRVEKDTAFKTTDDSPIPAAERAGF